MKEIQVMVNKYQAEDGTIFSVKEQCMIYEINSAIKRGKTITINDFINRDIVKSFNCQTSSIINFIHGTHRQGKYNGFCRCNLITTLKEDSIFNQKEIVYIAYTPYSITVYVHVDRKSWNKELQKFNWKNPHITKINEIDFNNF